VAENEFIPVLDNRPAMIRQLESDGDFSDHWYDQKNRAFPESVASHNLPPPKSDPFRCNTLKHGIHSASIFKAQEHESCENWVDCTGRSRYNEHAVAIRC
jgi:hypothetical protein